MKWASLLTFFGYCLVVWCYAPQWIKVLRTKSAGDLSPVFIGTICLGLALIQAGFFLVGMPLPIQLGNGAALLNAIILALSYLYVRRQCSE